MPDVHKPIIRSYNMSRIQAKDTKPEMLVRKYLHSKGFRYRLHVKQLPGKPDLVLPKYRTAIFIHGCFWHAHSSCDKFKLPETNSKWWRDKLIGNKERDERNIRILMTNDWKVIVIWECQLLKNNINETLQAIESKIRNC